MDWYRLFFVAFMILGGVYFLQLGLSMIGANIYDMWQFYRQKHLPAPKRTRPLVSVLIPAHNEAKSIIRCLDSVRKNSHHKTQILVIDDASTDNTRDLVRQYIKKYPNRNIHLLVRRKNAGKASALNHALKQWAKGEFVMTLDADSLLHKNAIKNALSYFQDPTVVGLAANVRVMDQVSILGLLQKFEHMIGYRSKKFYTMANCEFIVGGVASTYRRKISNRVIQYDTDTLTEDIGLSMKIISNGNRTNKIVYAADVTAMTEGVQSFKALLRQRYRWKMGSLQNLFKYRQLLANTNPAYSKVLTFYRIPMAFLGEVLLLTQPFVLAYVCYLSFAYHTPELFIGAYMVTTGYVLLTILPDEHSSPLRKLSLSLYAPFMYFIFYLMDVVQIAAIVRCLFNVPQVFRKVTHEGGWVSPERAGGHVEFS